MSALAFLVAWHIFGAVTIEHNARGVAVMYGIAGAWGVGDASFNSVRKGLLVQHLLVCFTCALEVFVDKVLTADVRHFVSF